MADNDNERDALVEVSLADFKRLLRALEHIVQRDERQRAQNEDDARRAARKGGPTTDEAKKRVRDRLRKLGAG